MQQQFVSQAEYARRIGVNPSTISRQVKSGRIPTVADEGGTPMIDVAAANSARRRNPNISGGHGGRPDRAIRRAVAFRARHSTGYDPAQRAMLCVMRSAWPDLVRKAMHVLGADEMNAARAVLAVQELVDCMAVVLHSDLNASRLWDYREALVPLPELNWVDPEVQAWFDCYTGGTWCNDDDSGIAGGDEFTSEAMEVAYAASPEKYAKHA